MQPEPFGDRPERGKYLIRKTSDARKYVLCERGRGGRLVELSDADASISALELYPFMQEMRAGIEDPSGDDPQYGVAEVDACPNTICKMAKAFGVEYEPVAAATRPTRPKFDVVTGLNFDLGEKLTAVSSRVADRLAPALSAWLHERYGSEPGPKLETPAEKTAREQATGEERKRMDREERARAKAAEKKQRQRKAVGAVEKALGIHPDRATEIIKAVGEYFDLA